MLRKKEPEGFRLLLERHGDPLSSHLHRRFGSSLGPDDLDEVISNTLIRVWRTDSPYDPALGTLRGWLVAIAENCARVELGRRQRLHLAFDELDRLTHPGDDDGAHGEAAPGGPPPGCSNEMWHDVLRCVAQLPRLQRLVLLADLESGDQVPAGELAAMLGSTPGSIYVARSKGLSRLRKRLQQLGHSFPADDDARARRKGAGTRSVTESKP